MRTWAFAALWLLGCHEPTAAGSPPVASTSQASASASAVAVTKAEPPEAPPRPPTWQELVLEEQWARAAVVLDETFGPQPKDPEVRYVRGRMAEQLGEHERAAELFEGLAKELPLLADDITDRLAKCLIGSGNAATAKEHFGARRDPASQLMAARAEEQAGDPKAAFSRVDRLVTRLFRDKRRSRQEDALLVRARAERARLAELLDRRRALITDLRWLSMEATTASEAIGADDKLDALGETTRLSAKERSIRALELAKDRQLDRALREVELASTAPGRKVAPAELAHIRGWAYYFARKYTDAARELAKASEASARYRVKDAFYAARALSRSQQDDEALEAYRSLAKKYPRSGYAEEARYLLGRIEYIRGNWKAADAAYGDHLKRYGTRGRFGHTIVYERAITSLALGAHAEAKAGLSLLIPMERSERRRARLEELRGVALLGLGEKDKARAAFEKVIADRPLSFAALASTARLSSMGAELPPFIAPSDDEEAAAPLQLHLPPRAALLHRMGFDSEAEDEVHERAAAIIKAHAPRGHEALCETYALLSTSAHRYRHAQRAIRESAVERAPSPRTAWAWHCMYPKPFGELVARVEAKQDLPQGLVHAVMRQESAFRHDAISPAGAHGLMQIIEPTAKRISKEMGIGYDESMLSSPGLNVRMGAHYLARLLDRFGGRIALAAAAYNAGPQTVSRWLESGERLPLDVFVARIPYGETRKYVQRVVGNHARYRFLSGGMVAVPRLDLEIPKGLRARKDDY